MRLFNEKTGTGLPTKLLSSTGMRAVTSKQAAAIISLLTKKKSMHSSAISKELDLPDQNVHYHIRNLRNAGVLEVDSMHDTQGGTAKMLKLTAPSFSIAFSEMKPLTVKNHDELEPFIVDGQWNAKIVASSPDPHGPESARGRDTQFAVDLAMFFGSFLESPPEDPLIFDTELRDWDQNLIIIGGPVVNKAAERINAKSPAVYDIEQKAFRTENDVYAQDNVGVIINMENPYSKGKRIILVAGKRYAGTRAAILTFLRSFEIVMKKELTVVLGMDKDSDGVIDHADILE